MKDEVRYDVLWNRLREVIDITMERIKYNDRLTKPELEAYQSAYLFVASEMHKLLREEAGRNV